jgi:hypothetical protein
MAALPPNLPWGQMPLGFDNPVEVTDLAIGGKMVTIRSEISDVNLQHMNDETWRQTIRSELAHKLATFILQHGLCEITTMQTPHSFSRTVAIRCYLAPNDQVKLLRIHKA